MTKPHAASRAAAENMLEATLQALQALRASWDEQAVAEWTEEILNRKGRVVLCGMGKSGLIAQKISATFASTGCPSFYLHPGEALHGDIGMVTEADAVLLLSNSGETDEVIALLPSILRMGIPIACITSNPASRMAQASKWCFSYRLPLGEGCPLQFAPMASTTLQLAWGDLLNAYRMAHTGFSLEKFASLHPAGNIGSRLLKVKDLMHFEPPTTHPEAGLIELLEVMTAGRLGMALVAQGGELRGVISDGDIRRALGKAESTGRNPLEITALDILSPQPYQIASDLPAVEAARMMEQRKVTFLVVRDATAASIGVIHIHDLLQAKVI